MRFPLRKQAPLSKRGPITSTGLRGGTPKRPTPRVNLPPAPSLLRPSSSVLQFEARAAADIGSAFDSLMSMLDLDSIMQAVKDGNLVEILDVLDLIEWLNFESQMIATTTPLVKQVIQAEGTRAFNEVRLAVDAGFGATASSSGRGTSPPKLPPTTFGDPIPNPGMRGGFYATGRFDMVDPFAVRQAEHFAADLVREVSNTTKAAIRETVASAFREGVTGADLARRLRNSIGLTSRQARAVENYRANLLRGGEMDEDRVEVLTRRYWRKTRNRRAETIARTEIMRASNFGRQQGWLAAADAGLLDRNASVKEWVTAPKGVSFNPDKPMVCPSCGPMDGVKVMGLETAFRLPGGKTVQMPPAHPNCRCTAIVHPPDPPEDWDPEYPHAQV